MMKAGLILLLTFVAGCGTVVDQKAASVSGMAKAGWVWEGLGFDPGVKPPIYGVGEGITYFGLDKANFIFHQNNKINLAKLSHASQVTADISKWVWFETKSEDGRFTFAQKQEASPDVVIAEAEKVSRLSLEFPNIVAAFIDDTFRISNHDSFTSETPKQIRRALRSHNPNLELWMVVYTHELDNQNWKDWLDHVDVINLWVWKSSDLPNLDQYIAKCRRLFPGKPIVMGVYIRDYSIPAPVPLDMLKIELETIDRHLKAGTLAGYNILGALMIDQHPEQAEFIRNFIHSH